MIKLKNKLIKKNVSAILLFIFITLNIPIYKTNAEENIGAKHQIHMNLKTKTYTGTEPFNTTNQGPGFHPGDDFSVDDEYVRTLDIVTYEFQYSVNPAGSIAKNVILTATIPKDENGNAIATWEGKLKDIKGVNISKDGCILTYNMGDVASGKAFQRSFTAKVSGNIKNGTKFSIKAKLQSDNGKEQVINSKDIIVSAMPKFDLIQKNSGYRERCLGPNKESGCLFLYSIDIVIPGGKGSEEVKGDITFTDDLKDLGLKNARLYTWGNYKAVGINGEGLEIIPHIPYGSVWQGYDKDKCVANSGSVVAKQSEPGAPIDITISGLDTSGNHHPTKNVNGTAISADEIHVFAGYIALWVDDKDILPGETTIKNKFTNLNLKSISGALNYGNGIEPMGNNSNEFLFRKVEEGEPGTGFDVMYVRRLGGFQKINTMTSIWSGDGTVLEGERFSLVGRYFNQGTTTLSGVEYLIKIDSKNLNLEEINKRNIAHIFYGQKVNRDDFEIKYGTGYYTNWKEQHDDCGEGNSNWYSTLKEAKESNTGDVVKVKVKLKEGKVMPVGSNFYIWLNLKAKTLKNENTIAPIGVCGKCNEENQGKWRLGEYNPFNHERVGSGDRINISKHFVRINKKSDKSTVNIGDKINFTLNPSITANNKIENSNVYSDIEIKEVLPKGVVYEKNSAFQGNIPLITEVIENEDGTSLIKWNLKNVNINKPIVPITYTAKVTFNVYNGENKNNLSIPTIVYSKEDASNENLRKHISNIQLIINKEWGIFKEVDNPIIEKNSDITYKLKYYKTTNEPYNELSLIDILPFNKDGKSPETSFSGEVYLKHIKVNNNEKIFVTYDNPKTINNNPLKDKTIWYEYNKISPEDMKKVTAIKIYLENLPQGILERDIDIILGTSKNKGGDVYNSSFTGRIKDINMLISSQDVVVRVKGDEKLSSIKSNKEEIIPLSKTPKKYTPNKTNLDKKHLKSYLAVKIKNEKFPKTGTEDFNLLMLGILGLVSSGLYFVIRKLKSE